MKFSEKMCPKTILKVTKNQDFPLSLEDTFFEKPQEEGGRGQIDLAPDVLGLNVSYCLIENNHRENFHFQYKIL